MTTTAPFSCILVGADTLLIQCAETLMDRGHEIRGVVSSTPSVVAWATKTGLVVLPPDEDYERILCADQFDYLFSIANLRVLPEAVIAAARVSAINFHDGPLPRYAGINAPAWALMAGERRYGISWHTMSAGIDEGDIVWSEEFDIAPDETLLTLNAKCFDTAIRSFDRVVDKLETGNAGGVPQDVSRRSYFGRHQRPAQACVLDWRRPAVELERMVRALNTGPYENPLGLPTVRLGDATYVVTSAALATSPTSALPGTITSILADELVVACGDGGLAIHGLATLSGREVKPARVEARASKHSRFEVLAPSDGARLTDLTRQLSRAESFWVGRLASVEPVDLPFTAVPSGEHKLERVPIPDSFSERFDSSRADSVVAAFALHMAKLDGSDFVDLSVTNPGLRERVAGLEPWLSTHLLVRAKVAFDDDFAQLQSSVERDLKSAFSRGPWLRDIVGRYPQLSGHHEFVDQVASVGVELCHDIEQVEPAKGSILTLAVEERTGACGFVYDTGALGESIQKLRDQFVALLDQVASSSGQPLATLSLLSDEERSRVLVEWNDTAAPYPMDRCVHDLFLEQVECTPDAIAIVFDDDALTYRELDQRAAQLACRLSQLGVGPDGLVGVCLNRSLDMMVAILGILNAGGAYVPIDPSLPNDRIRFMLEDSGVSVVITQDALLDTLPDHDADLIRIDGEWDTIGRLDAAQPDASVRPSNLAYVIYTSGSTGRPKGVMVEHGNVVSFFAGMDQRIPHEMGDTWFAVTSLSFDISVLELLWTLTRGFKVVIGADEAITAASAPSSQRGMDMGLFFWGSDDGDGPKKYRLLLECARFADENGFSSVWTPERHFHAFGGPYPNPAITSAALASITSRVKLRAGCVVLPLHHPIRVAEEWAVVDNLSNGRVGIGVASGWMPNDFVIRPENYADKKQVMFDEVDILRRLWRGEAVAFENGEGEISETRTLPRPLQDEVPIWITTAGNPDTFREAGAIGANILTHLLGQSVDEVAEKIQVYREALAEHGHDPESGQVTLMLHTFVGDDVETVRNIVRGPMKSYLGSAVSLVAKYAWTFPTYKRPDGSAGEDIDKLTEQDIASLSADEADAILEHAFERYFETSGLFGTPEKCMHMVDKLKAIGVNEIGCLMDYGVDTDTVEASLHHLARLRELANPTETERKDVSIPEQILTHGVTHFQCTPSLARLMLADDATRAALRSVDHLMVGGEALSGELVRELQAVVKGDITNMYGPTETTIWSSTHTVRPSVSPVPIGRPIANATFYVLDRHGAPTPVGSPGELFIGGPGVTRGYLHMPEATAQRYVQDPFAADGSRMYRTGDVVRWREDGSCEFLGRADFQVKVRGYRIELGEIESVLDRHPNVRESVVVTIDGEEGDTRLVGYVVGDEVDHDELRAHLRTSVPDYMVPAILVAIDRLPLTPNGKLDRRALPAPDQPLQAPTSETYVAPSTELERLVTEVWQETLGVGRVGTNDNFFDIGGHSLLIIRVHRRLQDVVAKPVKLTDLYRCPTISSLVQYLGDDLGDEKDYASVGAERGRRRRLTRGRR